MGIIKCLECGADISDMAGACPHCGAPSTTSNVQCAVNIQRKNKSAYAARKIQVLVDGGNSTFLENGATTRILLIPGHHTLSFLIGKKTMAQLDISAYANGSEINIICGAKSTGGIEASLTDVDVSHLINQTRHRVPLLLRLLIAIPIIAVLLYILLFGIKFVFWFVVKFTLVPV